MVALPVLSRELPPLTFTAKLAGSPLPPLGALPPLSAPKAPKRYGEVSATAQIEVAPADITAFVKGVASKSLYPDCPPARILVADPPWQFGDNTPHKGATDHYKTMSIEELCAFPLPPLADDAILFMWRVAGGSAKDGSLGEQAYQVMRAWGFTPKSEMAWMKTRECKTCDGKGHATSFGTLAGATKAEQLKLWCEDCHGRGYKLALGMGRYVRGTHEVCLIGTRGKPIFPELKNVASSFNSHRLSHSEKPLRFFEKVAQLYPIGPHVELFARRHREGWHCFGDQLPSKEGV
jgi:N6-adenosine-specific RNA methylase IME4